jgi:putative nucleotidyltransferase with HDIG domain
MATGEADVRIGIEAMRHGAADYLLKPFHPQAVVASLRRAIRIKAMERELEDYRRGLERMVEERTRQLEKARQRIEMTYDETLEALGGALDLRDSETSGHSYRVTRYCLEMARVLGATPDQLKQIARGAFLHDIGKIAIPDSILLKQGKLTAEERAIMEAHARIGYNLVSRIAFLAPAAEIILTHQERYDGLGYPQGLGGEEIPLGARTFAVADTLDAMTSNRPYRRALPYAAAREEIVREAGHQFDPKVVEAFLSIPEDVWAGIRTEVAALRLGGQSGQAAKVTRRAPDADSNIAGLPPVKADCDPETLDP